MDPKQRQFSIWYVFIAIWLMLLIQTFVTPLIGPKELPYTDFKKAVAEDKILEVAISQTLIHGRAKDLALGDGGDLFKTIRVEDPRLLEDLEQHHVTVTGVIESTFWRDVLSWVIPALVFVGLWWLILRRMGQGQGTFMTVGQSKAKIYMEREVKISFVDVAGVDEAKQELQEVIEFLKTPEKFQRLGGKIP
jgi:cell division protease FtsH